MNLTLEDKVEIDLRRSPVSMTDCASVTLTLDLGEGREEEVGTFGAIQVT